MPLRRRSARCRTRGRPWAREIGDLHRSGILPATAQLLIDAEADRAALIGRLYQREDAQAIAEVLLDVEADPDDLVRLRLIAALQEVFGIED